MHLISLFSEIQANPKNIRAYRRLIDHYRKQNMINEEQAFISLLEEKFDIAYDSNPDEEQRTNN